MNAARRLLLDEEDFLLRLRHGAADEALDERADTIALSGQIDQINRELEEIRRALWILEDEEADHDPFTRDLFEERPACAN